MLGLDVHDCANARDEMYRDGVLEEATSSPWNRDCTSRPTTSPCRGVSRVGVRIEDDVLVTAPDHRISLRRCRATPTKLKRGWRSCGVSEPNLGL